MYNKKMIAMMLTLSMLAASLAGCAGGDDDDDDEWAISMASDIEVVWVESGWDPIIPNLNAGEMCDVIISAMTKTEARDQVVDFTRAYYTSSQGVIGGSGSASISDVSELNAAGITVGVQSGTTSDIFANGDADNVANLADATVSAYDDFPSVIAALNNGDVMYALGDAPVLALEGTLMTQFSDENFGFAVREDSGELLDALDVAIGAIVDSGEYDTIFQASFDGSAVLADDTTADTATAYPASPSEGSTLTGVLESGQLKVCTDPFYPPFESYDANNNVVGFDANVAHAVVDEIAAHYMGTENPVFSVQRIKIGTLYDTTGGLSAYAGGFEAAISMAFEDLNAMDDGYVFENIYADSGGASTTASAGASSLVSAGVVAVVGAAGSDASIGANSVLGPAGIPMISFASTSPTLSDAVNYPNFFRVVPSDYLQGQALADVVEGAGYSNTAIIAQNDAYGAGLADGFAANFDGDVCARYDFDQTAFDALVDTEAAIQGVAAAGNCDSVVFVTYPDAGAQFIGAMYVAGVSLPYFGGDGMAGLAALSDYADSGLANGMVTTSPKAGASSYDGDFPTRCAADLTIVLNDTGEEESRSGCGAGIYTSEAYDAVMMAAAAAKMENGANMATHIAMVGSGDGFPGASGTHVFQANGDVTGSGYDVCTFQIVPTYGDYFNCMQAWDGSLSDVVFAGETVKIGYMGDQSSAAIAGLWPSFMTAGALAMQMANAIGYSNGVQFELVTADTGCDGNGVPATGTTAADQLLLAGVWGAVGAACSGASIAANAVLSPAGIPMISYASTSPALSDNATYPDFFRVVPSDIGQAQALADIMNANGEVQAQSGGVAVIAAQADYTANLGNLFAGYTNSTGDFIDGTWQTDGGTLCMDRIDYDNTDLSTDYDAVTQPVVDNGCGTVVIFSYNEDGASIISELREAGFTGHIYGTDGIASVTTADSMTDTDLEGVIASQPGTAASARGALVASLWPTTDADGDGEVDVPMGQYALEAFDALTIMAFSAFTQLANPGMSASQAIAATGTNWDGATGVLNFLPNGDTLGQGYCIGEFIVTNADTVGEGDVAFVCTHSWGFDNGLTEITTSN